jgi:two-component system, OmpR family, response regulator PhoP
MARVLLAEPNRAIREFIAGILGDFGHDVQSCENAIEASVWLATAVIDVLVTDMMLTGDQGLDLSKQCAALGIPTVTLTGREFYADKSRGDQPPGLLEKPFRFSDLRSVLDAVESSRPPIACFSNQTPNAA